MRQFNHTAPCAVKRAGIVDELSRVLMRLDHVASFIVHANHGIVSAAVILCVAIITRRLDSAMFQLKSRRIHGNRAGFIGNIPRRVGSIDNDVINPT